MNRNTMQNANMSASERTRFLGARTLAIYHLNNPQAKEGGASKTFDSSMVGYRIPGQHAYAQQTAEPPVSVIAACCSAATVCEPPGSTFIITQDGFGSDPATVIWDPVANATYYTITTADPDVTVDYPDNTATTVTLTRTGGSGPFMITISAFNACGSSSTEVETGPCFLAGSLVAMADGTFKAIETVAIGDFVIGAFGEINEILALHRPLLGNNTMCKINGEHSTTSHHPHISVDKLFYCMHPTVVETTTYGCEHEVITLNGKEMMYLHGLNAGRVKTLEVGIVLKTIDGSRSVNTLESYALPHDTQLYNLVVGGSHTYHVDGYAVTGWPREDDFNYDTWMPKS